MRVEVLDGAERRRRRSQDDKVRPSLPPIFTAVCEANLTVRLVARIFAVMLLYSSDPAYCFGGKLRVPCSKP